MNRRILQAFLGACLALAVGGLAAQTPATGGDTSAKSDAQATPSAQSQTSAQQPSSTSKQAKAKKSSHHTKTASGKTSSSKTASTKSKSQHVAKAKSSHGTAKPKSKADESMMSPDESAYRQALRGCVTQSDQSQRDSCIDQTIQKYGRNA